MVNHIDNGGAIAIKGFNYQKASLILVIINNYKKEGFKVVPEAEDDFQVHVDGGDIFIQVKGSKGITLGKLINDDIISKNLCSGTDDDRRKIFVWDLGPTFRKNLEDINDGSIVTPLLNYSQSDFDDIKSKINCTSSEEKRLKNQRIYKTPFSNNMQEAIKQLLGEMLTNGLHIDNESGRALIAELSLMIDTKSEIEVTENNFSDKTLSSDYFNDIFIKVEEFRIFNKILEKLNYNSFKIEKIKKEKTKILIGYQSMKAKILVNISGLDLENSSEEVLVQEILDVIASNQEIEIENENLRIALAIECLCALWEVEQ